MCFSKPQAETAWAISKHRKITSSFRDTQLFDIFQLSCDMLRKALEMIKTFDLNDSSQVNNEGGLQHNTTFIVCYFRCSKIVHLLNSVPNWFKLHLLAAEIWVFCRSTDC